MLLTVLLSAIVSVASENVVPASLAATPDGKVWMAAVSDAGLPTGQLDLYGSADFGNWEGPLLHIGAEGQSVTGGALYVTSDGMLHLFYSTSEGVFDGRGEVWSRYYDGREWSAARQVGIGRVTTPPVQAPDGTLVLAVALPGGEGIDPAFRDAHPELDGRRGAIVYRSSDGGKSWQDAGISVQAPSRRPGANDNPKLFTTPDGQVRMALRSFDTGFSYVSSSSDNGRSWSLPNQFVLHPDRNLCVHTLRDGRVLLIKNFRLDWIQYYTARELFAYLSDDGGQTWYYYRRVTTDDYALDPVVCEGPGGEIYAAYAHAVPGSSEIKTLRLDGEALPAVALTASLAGAAWERHIAPVAAPREHWTEKPLRLASYNIQRQGWGGGPPWTERRDAVIAEFKEHDWDLVGTQEAAPAYADEICRALGGAYAWVGNVQKFYGDRYRGGSEQPIFYRKSRLELLDYGPLEYSNYRTIFAGATMCEDSYGVDYYKATTWARFLDKATGQEFYLYNLHFPVRADSAQEAQAVILREDLIARSGGLPVMITGDFNSYEDSWAYHYLTELSYLSDSMTLFPEAERKNWEYHSCPGYRTPDKIPLARIHLDHIFVTPATVQVLDWELDPYTMHDGKFASDHLPITINLKMGS